MSGLFYKLARRLGRTAVPTLRQSRQWWASLAGEPAEAWRAEEKLGAAMAEELRSSAGLTSDRESENNAGRICQRLAEGLKDPIRAFSCEMLADPVPGAMALPGGFLFITEGLFRFCQGNPDELAFLIGHEMGHVVRGHARDRLLNEAALRLVSVVSLRAGKLGQWYREQGAAKLREAYGQHQEFEADLFGADLAVTVGYGPMGPIELLERVGRLQTHGGQAGAFFDSHPPLDTRLSRLRFQPPAAPPSR